MRIILGLFLLSLCNCVIFDNIVFGQEKLPTLKVVSIKKFPLLKVGDDRFDREITFSLANSTDRTVEVYGRFNGSVFDPSGDQWLIDPKTGEVNYFDPEDKDEHEKAILTIKKYSRVFTALKPLMPGEEYTFTQLDLSTKDCVLAWKGIPLWFRFANTKKVIKITSDLFPAGFEPCQAIPGITTHQ